MGSTESESRHCDVFNIERFILGTFGNCNECDFDFAMDDLIRKKKPSTVYGHSPEFFKRLQKIEEDLRHDEFNSVIDDLIRKKHPAQFFVRSTEFFQRLQKIEEDLLHDEFNSVIDDPIRKKRPAQFFVRSTEFLKRLQKIEEDFLHDGFMWEVRRMIFQEVILSLMRFLSMNMSSRCKKNYILFWTDKAVLLVLWTCGDVEVNPGPTEDTNRTSTVLRRFRRRLQKKLLELLYQNLHQEIPKNIFERPPPGWDKYKPEIEFGNISNLPKGKTSGLGSKEDQIFSKMLYLLQSNTTATLSPEWESLLKHYHNLNTKREQEESKKAILKWLNEKELAKMLERYAKEVEDPSEDIRNTCLAIAQRKRKRCPSKIKSVPATKMIKRNETDLVDTQDLSENVDLPDTETFAKIINDIDDLQYTMDLEECLNRLENPEPSSKMF